MVVIYCNNFYLYDGECEGGGYAGVRMMEVSAGNGWNSRKQKEYCSMEYWNGN